MKEQIQKKIRERLDEGSSEPIKNVVKLLEKRLNFEKSKKNRHPGGSEEDVIDSEIKELQHMIKELQRCL